MKTCIKCGETKPETEYWARRNDCKGCASKRAKKTRAKWLERKQAQKDLGEHDYGKKELPEGFDLVYITQELDAGGNVVRQWPRGKAAGGGPTLEETVDVLRDLFDAEARRFKLPRVKKPRHRSNAELKGVVPIGDGHIGLMTWAGDTPESYDLKTAQSLYRHALASAIESSASYGCESILLAALGDFVHTDGPKNATTKGTPVSVDGRWPKILFAAVNTLEFAVLEALKSHKRVDLSIIAGNHDQDTTTAVVVALSKLFQNNPRVTVNLSFQRFHYYQHGKCLIGTTHGDMAKVDKLPFIMAQDCPKIWGDTVHRHWYTGHVHHDTARKYNPQKPTFQHADMGTVSVETMRVLVPQDYWHHGSGYRSIRDIKCDIWHAEDGIVQRNRFGIERLRRGLCPTDLSKPAVLATLGCP